MKSSLHAMFAGLVAQAAAHATFQQLWVDGVDKATQCTRMPKSNSPVSDVKSLDTACNAGTSPVPGKCPVPAGAIVTVEMHQQPNDRSCTNEAIGGAHYGPVLIYMAQVPDSATAVGAEANWFKVFESGYAASGQQGCDGQWGTKDLNACCGKVDFKVPAELAPGDYLLRAEAIALHAAQGENGAQMYMTCFQLSVTGSGTLKPPTVKFPGAYDVAHPGLKINIYQALPNYVMPGPPVIPGGLSKAAGNTCPKK